MIAVIVVLVVGFAAAATFPEQAWIEAVAWIAALGVALLIQGGLVAVLVLLRQTT